MSQAFIAEIATRRSIYALGKKLSKPAAEVDKLVKDTVHQLPSSFNCQSSRFVVLHGEEHQKVWQIVKDALKKVVTDPEAYKASEAKVDGCFAAGAGTILFYEDTDVIKGQQKQFPSYAANFPVWSQHSSAIAQFAVWTALAQEGIGASLQHYNELIAKELEKTFSVPATWQLIAQMPFGSIEKPAEPRQNRPDEGRFMFLGSQ